MGIEKSLRVLPLEHLECDSENVKSEVVVSNDVTSGKGATWVEMDGMKCVCVVDPLMVLPRHSQNPKQGVLDVTVRFSPFVKAVTRKDEQRWEAILRTAIEPFVLLGQYPNMGIGIHVYVLENSDDEAMLRASVVGVSNGLMQCGISMVDTISASTRSSDTWKVTVVCSIRSRKVSYIHITGRIRPETLRDTVSKCIDGSADIDTLAREAMKKWTG